MHLLIIGVMISNLIVPERVEVPFQNHSTPYNSGGSMVIRDIASHKLLWKQNE
jgi:hypothetical protein